MSGPSGGPIARRFNGLVLLAASVATAFLLILAAPSHSAEDLSGVWIVTDGPHAGWHVDANKDGEVTGKGLTLGGDDTHGHIVKPERGCRTNHFEGSINGDKSARACWHVIPAKMASDLVTELSDAVTKEFFADKGLHYAVDLQDSSSALEKAFDSAAKQAGPGGTLTARQGELVREQIERIHKLDREAERAAKNKDKPEYNEKVGRALELKSDLISRLPRKALLVQPPKLTPIKAAFDSTKRLTVYTEDATKSTDSGYLDYDWTLLEHNDPSCIFFEPRTPERNQATWHHGDDQGCNHALEGPMGHVGTITVLVADDHFKCFAFYNGSQGPNGMPNGVGPEPLRSNCFLRP